MNQTRHALVVEDLAVWQDMLCEILGTAGYRVTAVCSYEAALEALERDPCHLAVLDPVLDDNNRHNRDGLRVLSYILENHPDMRTIVTTSSDPNRIRKDVAEISARTPILWKDEWDDALFLATLNDLFGQNPEEA